MANGIWVWSEDGEGDKEMKMMKDGDDGLALSGGMDPGMVEDECG